MIDPKNYSNSLLHTSSRSKSSVSPASLPGMDESIMTEMTGVGMNEQFFVTNDDNPEAMFDMLTLQSIRERYSDIDDNKVSSTEDISAAAISDQEFDNFVRDFPIDDSISECFAAASTDQIVPSVNVLTKNANSPSKQNKLKKKLVQRNGNEETILSDEDSRSSDSKRSKLIGNLFGRKNKAKDGYKPLKQTDTSTGNDITDAIIDACEHITKSYKKPKSSSASNSVTSDKSVKKEKIGKPLGNSDSNSEKSRTLSPNGSPNKALKNNEKVQLRKLPPLPDPEVLTTINKIKEVYPLPVQSLHDSLNRIAAKRAMHAGNSIFENIDNCSDEQLIQDLTSLPENDVIQQRDKHGNTILHRCILANKEDTALVLLANYPDLVLIVNNEGLTASDLIVKVGSLKCLKFLLETQYKSSEIETLARITNIAAENNQIESLKEIITYLLEHRSSQTLPTDLDGNTAAHVAAINGQLNCLQLLVENGFSLWNANKAGHRPMQLAIQNEHLECFHYLLMLECSQCLIRQATTEAVRAERLKSQRVSVQTSMQQLGQHLSRYYTQFNDALRNLLESRANILHSVDSVYSCTSNIVQNTELQHDEVLRNDIENLKAEMERLQDLLEFSPLATSSDILSRMVSGFQELLVSEKESSELDRDTDFKTEDALKEWSIFLWTGYMVP
ncbi:hypothetical protein KUTeg_010847 [Tegillarca granosa]|uniref:Uncharacterized protein n=1 Tax=Tegillarca granosa TaxID=220873 RepID=A0ABQ9F5C7_TEGGR|nr:hypothetical protein KUTeg_010847 [Tegillarca granosa]